MKDNCSLGAIASALRTHRTFAVVSHVRPDGDALGCQIATALCLKELGKQVRVWNEDGMLDKYRFLPQSDLVVTPPASPQNFDVVVALDTASRARLGKCLEAIGNAQLWINIDHHPSNDHFGDLAYIDPSAPATGQIVFELIRQHDLPMTRAMADNLFVAISTDTGSFQYPNTSARSFEIAAELVRWGVNIGDLSQEMYESYPRRRIELLRELLNELRFTCSDRVASFGLSISAVNRVGARPEDNEGLIDHIRAIDGVIVAAFLEELTDGKVRISLRSKTPDVDVCSICSQFGGGGHTLAAGARTKGTLAEVQEKVLTAICDEINRGT
jgi:bifunctional oligoribonuclease and PAP phosphatase NrnA